MGRNGEVIDIGTMKDASNTDDTMDVEDWLKLYSLTLFANIKNRRERYQIYLPSTLSVARGSPQTECYVVHIDIDSVHFLELSPYLDMDVDQVNSVRVSLCCSQQSSMSSGEHDFACFCFKDVALVCRIDLQYLKLIHLIAIHFLMNCIDSHR